MRTNLPVVDLRAEPAELRTGLRTVAHDVGFFHLTGHGVPAELSERVSLSARERISVPYFFNPRLDAQLPVLRLPTDLAADARGVTADPSNERIFSVYGQNAWKSRLRAHPDVAAAHGYRSSV